MIWASGTMFGSSTPNASQDGTAGRNVNSELLYILFQHARCAGNQALTRAFYVFNGIFFEGFFVTAT